MIDIIIPAYNRERTIGRTLASLVAQSDQNFNVIIVDDASTDNMKLEIDKYQDLLNIIYVRHEVNKGPGLTRQSGLDNALSQFVIFLDSDDMLMPYAVETFNTAIKSNPNIEFLYTYFYEQIYLDGEMVLVLWKDNFSALHGKLYNREALKKFNIRFDPEVSYWSEDAYLNSICTELLEISVLKVPTMIWIYNDVDSVLRGPNPDRDKNHNSYFIFAMQKSIEFAKQYKSDISHLKSTVGNALAHLNLSEEEKININKLLEGGQ